MTNDVSDAPSVLSRPASRRGQLKMNGPDPITAITRRATLCCGEASRVGGVFDRRFLSTAHSGEKRQQEAYHWDRLPSLRALSRSHEQRRDREALRHHNLGSRPHLHLGYWPDAVNRVQPRWHARRGGKRQGQGGGVGRGRGRGTGMLVLKLGRGVVEAARVRSGQSHARRALRLAEGLLVWSDATAGRDPQAARKADLWPVGLSTSPATAGWPPAAAGKDADRLRHHRHPDGQGSWSRSKARTTPTP